MKAWLYRAFALIALLIVGTSIWYVKSNPHDYKECAKAAQIAAYDDLMLDASIDAITPARQAQYKQAIIDNQIKCSDLGAQWGMTDIALLGYVAGLLGLFFLGITVFETQSAATSARDTLRLTEDALNNARLATQKELSPSVTAEKLSIIFDKPVTPHSLGKYAQVAAVMDYTMTGNMSVIIKNWGNTHISDIKLRGKIKLIEIDNVAVDGYRVEAAPECGGVSGNLGMLAPQQELVLKLNFFITYNFRTHTKGQAPTVVPINRFYMSVYGDLVFQDVFTKDDENRDRILSFSFQGRPTQGEHTIYTYPEA